jgi:hypothetical protein
MDHRVAAVQVRWISASDRDLGAAGSEHCRGGGPGPLGVLAGQVVDDPQVGALVEQRSTEAAPDESQATRDEHSPRHS